MIQTARDLFNEERVLERYKKNGKQATSERAELYRMFLQKLNPPRIKAKLQPLTGARLGYLLEGIPTADLYALDSKCSQATGYSQMWWTIVKPKSA